MNSFMISAMSTQICNMLRPRVSYTSTSFKTGMVSPDAICRIYDRLGFLLGCPATMLGLVMIRHPIADGHKVWLVSYPALSNQDVIVPLG
jgi:hypothetical protein